MIELLVGAQEYVGVAGLGFVAGVVFAAWRQLELEGRS